MKILISIISVIFLATTTTFAQVDTMFFSNQVNSLLKPEDHKAFWTEIYHIDQTYRGRNTNETLDKVNLIKACYYFNKFGYPKYETCGDNGGIISLVWIHNKYPNVRKFCFPIIMAGYHEGFILEDDFRNYYSRAIYKRMYSDENYEKKPIETLISLIDVNTDAKIDISILLQKFDIDEGFLNQKHTLVGKWKGVKALDTIYHNDKALIKTFQDDPVIIFKDEKGDYYFKKLHEDKSHYPQKLSLVKQNGKVFSFFSNEKVLREYLEILDSGELKIVNKIRTVIHPREGDHSLK